MVPIAIRSIGDTDEDSSACPLRSSTDVTANHTLRIVCPNGHLGFAPIKTGSFRIGCHCEPDLICADSGSCDVGPVPLGADISSSPLQWQTDDLETMLLASRRLGVPMIVGSAGDTGTNSRVDLFVGSLDPTRIVCIAFVVIGLIGLKLDAGWSLRRKGRDADDMRVSAEHQQIDDNGDAPAPCTDFAWTEPMSPGGNCREWNNGGLCREWLPGGAKDRRFLSIDTVPARATTAQTAKKTSEAASPLPIRCTSAQSPTPVRNGCRVTRAMPCGGCFAPTCEGHGPEAGNTRC